jgi:ATP-binding cassette, subfamily B (MDR/TAP), member 1
VYKLRVNIFDKLLRLPVAYYDKPTHTPGAISSKLAQDAFQIHNMTTGVLGVVFLNIATIVTSMVIALYYSWQLTLIVIGLSPLLVVSNAVEMNRVKAFTSKNESSEKFIGSIISDTINNIRTVKSFANNKAFFGKYESKLQELLDNNSKKVFQTAIFQAFSKGNIMVIEGIMFYLASILFQNSVIIEPEAVYIAIFSVIFAAAGVGSNSAYMPDMAKAKIAGANIF